MKKIIYTKNSKNNKYTKIINKNIINNEKYQIEKSSPITFELNSMKINKEIGEIKYYIIKNSNILELI